MKSNSHLSVIWMTLARQRAVLPIEPVFPSGVAGPHLTDLTFPPVGAIATPVLRVAAAAVQAFACFLAVNAVGPKRAELMALKTVRWDVRMISCYDIKLPSCSP